MTPSLVAHTCHHDFQEVETEGSEVQDDSWVSREFEDNLGYIKPGSKKSKQITKQKQKVKKLVFSTYGIFKV